MTQTDSRIDADGELVFGVSELAARSGVPVPTIHYYRKLGLLPPATQAVSNRFGYRERHVLALDLIRSLRAHQVPLDTVREVLPALLAAGGVGLTEQAWQTLVAAGSVAPIDPAAERLLDAARAAFARRGYDGVSVGEICDTVGIAKGTFYRYFDSKEAVFVAAARSTVEAVGEALDRRGGTLSRTEAVGELESLLAPLAPLLLEAATRELRAEPRSSGIVASVAQGLAARLRPRLAGSSAVSAARQGARRSVL